MADTVQGIILRQTKTAAGGRRMLEIFTDRYGKVSASSYPERKGKKRTDLAIRPFTLGEYSFLSGRGSFRIEHAEAVRSYFGIGEEPDRFLAASFVLELTDRSFPENEPSGETFELLRDFLTVIEHRKRGFLTPVLAYEIHLLSILGIFPVMNRCVVCGEPLRPENSAGFGILEGGMLCGDCLRKIQESTGAQLIYNADFGIITAIEYFAGHPMKAFQTLTLERTKAKNIQKAVREYFAYYLEIGALRSDSALRNLENV